MRSGVEFFREDAREQVALQFRDERERDARVALVFEELTAGLELAGRFRRLDHRPRDAVADRAGRVRALELARNGSRRAVRAAAARRGACRRSSPRMEA